MADFFESFQKTISNEEYYTNDPADNGGETFMGVSRKHNPKWSGWTEIDRLKESDNFPRCLKENKKLKQIVRKLYKRCYWDKVQGDEIPNQEIANELFDTSVNLGVTEAITIMQNGLNILNRNGRLYDDLVMDGKFGPKTRRALMFFLEIDNPKYLLKVLNILQGTHYIAVMRHDPKQEKFARGWLERAEIRED